MQMYDIIMKKRSGAQLSKNEIENFITLYTAGKIPDYQASALLMAIWFNGMTDEETVNLTTAMELSGDTVDLSRFGHLTADKHSTGGVGDKTTLIVAPVAASLGLKTAKMSGRGLGHTGGTVDKLEAIPGYRTSLSPEEFLNQVEKTGIAVIGQSGNLAPADKKLYALRDVTATVDSIPLITSSIMSKKLAAGSKNIVLDVKCGSGAFMKTPGDAKTLAGAMVGIGKLCGRNVAALITDMDKPLGSNVGNSLEIIEAVSVLKGEEKGDLREICVALASEMTALALNITTDEARRRAENSLDSGAAFDKMKEWISAQGGDVSYIEDTSKFEKAKYGKAVTAPTDGYIYSMNAEEIGLAGVTLGAGRAKKEDSIDFSAGIIINKKTGDKVSKSETLYTLLTNNQSSLEQAAQRCLNATVISDAKPESKPLIYEAVR